MKYGPVCLFLPICPLHSSHWSGSESICHVLIYLSIIESSGKTALSRGQDIKRVLTSLGYILTYSTDFSSRSQAAAVCIGPKLNVLTGWTKTLFFPYKRCVREFWCKDSTYSLAEAAKRSSDVLPLECRFRI